MLSELFRSDCRQEEEKAVKAVLQRIRALLRRSDRLGVWQISAVESDEHRPEGGEKNARFNKIS